MVTSQPHQEDFTELEMFGFGIVMMTEGKLGWGMERSEGETGSHLLLASSKKCGLIEKKAMGRPNTSSKNKNTTFAIDWERLQGKRYYSYTIVPYAVIKWDRGCMQGSLYNQSFEMAQMKFAF